MGAKPPNGRSAFQRIYYEIRAAGKMTYESLFVNIPAQTVYGKNAFIIPGFVAPARVYASLAQYLCSLGINTAVARYHWYNPKSYVRRGEVLTRTVGAFRETYGKIHFLIGHSLGGIQVLSLLPKYYQEIEKAIIIAAPINGGKPLSVVQLATLFGIHFPYPLQSRVITRIIKNALPYAHKIVTVTSMHDIVCSPPYCAAFPGARNIIVDDSMIPRRKRGEERFYQTHTALPNSPFVRKRILKEFLRT